jgi:hypothetical protein
MSQRDEMGFPFLTNRLAFLPPTTHFLFLRKRQSGTANLNHTQTPEENTKIIPYCADRLKSPYDRATVSAEESSHPLCRVKVHKSVHDANPWEHLNQLCLKSRHIL